jgi:hypothetical protein
MPMPRDGMYRQSKEPNHFRGLSLLLVVRQNILNERNNNSADKNAAENNHHGV